MRAAPALALIADGWSEDDGLDLYTIVAVIALTIGAVLILAIIAAHNRVYTTVVVSRSADSHGKQKQAHGHDQYLAKRLLAQMGDTGSVFYGQWPHGIISTNDTPFMNNALTGTNPAIPKRILRVYKAKNSTSTNKHYSPQIAI